MKHPDYPCLFIFLFTLGTIIPSNSMAQHSRLAAGLNHIVGINKERKLSAWGSNSKGQCVPPPISQVKSVAAGDYHSLALDDNGRVYAWGANDDGQCDVPEGLKAIAIAAGSAHSVAISENGKIIIWGSNRYNQCAIPKEIQNERIKAIAAGSLHTLVIKNDGKLSAWGSSNAGESSPPQEVIAHSISCNGDRCVALDSSGFLVQWGSQSQMQVPKYTQFESVKLGNEFLAGIKSDGKLQMFESPARSRIELTSDFRDDTAGLEFASSSTIFVMKRSDDSIVVRTVDFLSQAIISQIQSIPENLQPLPKAVAIARSPEEIPNHSNEKANNPDRHIHQISRDSLYSTETELEKAPFIFNSRSNLNIKTVALVQEEDVSQCAPGIHSNNDLYALAEVSLLQFYELLERHQLEHSLDELKLSLSGITSNEGLQEAGKIKNAQGYVFLQRICDDGKHGISVKLISCETTELIWSAIGIGMEDLAFFKSLTEALEGHRSPRLLLDKPAIQSSWPKSIH